jgi:hypothetical protein
MPPLVIVSYSHRDESWKNSVVEHLRVVAAQGEFVEWDDRQIEAGATWRQDIDDAAPGGVLTWRSPSWASPRKHGVATAFLRPVSPQS